MKKTTLTGLSMMAVLFLTAGIPVFIWSRKENNPLP